MGIDHEFFKKPVHESVVRKSILKFIILITPNSKGAKYLKKYLATKNITPREYSYIRRNWKTFINICSALLTGIICYLLHNYMPLEFNPVIIFVLIPHINFGSKVFIVLLIDCILPNTIKGSAYLTNRYNTAADYLLERQKRAAFSNIKTKKTMYIDWYLLYSCFLLGVFGVHRFMLGDIKNGLLMLVTFGGFGIWTLLDLLKILKKEMHRKKIYQ